MFRDSARGRSARSAPHRELPVAAGGARRGQRAVRRGIRRELPGPGPQQGTATRVRDTLRASRDRQGVVRGLRSPLASGRGAPRCAPCPRPGRRRGRDARRDRPAVRCGDRRRVVRGGVPRGRSADDPDDRATVFRATAGRRPALLSPVAAEPLRRRGSAHRSRVSVRRRLERRSRPHPLHGGAASDLQGDRALAADGSRGGRPSARARIPAAVRASRRELDAALARAAVRAHPRRARLRLGGADPAGRSATVCEPAQAGQAGAIVRGAPGPGHRGLHPVRRAAGRGRGARARRRLRGGRRRRRPAADDPRREGSRVQGGRRRRRRPRTDANGRDPLPVGRAVRIQGRPPGNRVQSGDDLLPERQGDTRPRGGRRAAAPLLRRDDARDGAADRLGIRRPFERTRRADTHRVGSAAVATA